MPGPGPDQVAGSRRWAARGRVGCRWVLPGLLAGVAFLLFEMLVGLFTTTGWAFPEGIAHTVGIGSDGYTLQPARG